MNLIQRFQHVRAHTAALCAPLSHEDMLLQTMPDVSPTRWHLAHTTWFFDTFVLGSRTAPKGWDYLFNSYYNGAGPQFPRDRRGTQSRPTVAEILDWRATVDQAIVDALRTDEHATIVEIGTHHEQQHQELMLTDIKHVLYNNPLAPVFGDVLGVTPRPTPQNTAWLEFEAGIGHVGHGSNTFAFDNESPQHRVFVEAFEIATAPVTNREFLEFVLDGAYQNPKLWFAEAWSTIAREQWQHPLYWRLQDSQWQSWTLQGWQPLELEAPACHLSLYEADAYAHWAGARLPTEFEWEIALANHCDPESAFGVGQVWEWTSSAYGPYPGFKSWAGTLGEYNGKFMLNQYVLRGGSLATPSHHIRPTYRNFFPANTRWQFSGLRLARGVH